jgi:hypothetical protein
MRIELDWCSACHIRIALSNADNTLQYFLPRYGGHIFLFIAIAGLLANLDTIFNHTALCSCSLHRVCAKGTHNTCAFHSELVDPTKDEVPARTTK